MVPVDEALDEDPFAEDVIEVGDAVFLLGLLVVLRDLLKVLMIVSKECRMQDKRSPRKETTTYHATHDDLAKPLHIINSSLEMVTADILVHHVQPIWRQPLEGIPAGLLGVVEALVGAQLLDHVLGLVIRADATNNTHPFLLCQLDYDLAHGAGRCVDPDGLTCFGLDEAVE